MSSSKPILKIGTDCSGLESPLMALKKLKIPYHHVWSCDFDINCKRMILENHEPDFFFNNILDKKLRREHLPVNGAIDIYITGFPCPAYSLLANNLAPDGREKKIKQNRKIVMAVLETIAHVRPKTVIVENVPQFVKQKDYRTACNRLKRMGYDVFCEILNSIDYGSPQNRSRMYLVAIHQSVDRYPGTEFVYPPRTLKRVTPMSVIQRAKRIKTKRNVENDDFANRNLTQACRNVLEKFKKKINENGYVFLNLTDASRHNKIPADPKRVSCVTTNCKFMYNVPEKRYATINELLILQGFDPKKIKQVVSPQQICKQVGNSMNVHVLEAIFKSLLAYVKFY